jgi:hypothetical protein
MQETIARLPTPPTGSVPNTSDRLPQGMVEDAAKRLGWLALVVAIIIPSVQVFQRLAQPMLTVALDSDSNRLATLVSELMALGVFALRRYRVVLPRVLLVIGMVWEVMVSFCIAMIETTVPPDPAHPTVGISSIAPWIITVGVFIPNRPAWTLLTALAAATTWPIAYLINAALHDFPPGHLGQLAT